MNSIETFEEYSKQASKYLDVVDILKYIEYHYSFESDENAIWAYYLELLKRCEDLKGEEIELYVKADEIPIFAQHSSKSIKSKTMITNKDADERDLPANTVKIVLPNKVTSINQWERLCLTLGSVLNLALFHDFSNASTDILSRQAEMVRFTD